MFKYLLIFFRPKLPFPVSWKSETEVALGMRALSKLIAFRTWLKSLIQTPCFYRTFLWLNLIWHGRSTMSAQSRRCAPTVLHCSGAPGIQTSCFRRVKQINKLCSCIWQDCVLAGRYDNGLLLCSGKSWFLYESSPMSESESCFFRVKVDSNCN